MGKTWQNSNAIKNYFPLPNEIYRLGLSPAEVSIYTWVKKYLAKGEEGLVDTGIFPSP